MAEAYVTLATNDTYAVGALVLAHSLKSVQTSKQLCILITPDVSLEVRCKLEDVYNNVVTVNILDSSDSAHLSLLKRPELGVTLTKLHCWSLTQYSKCVFLDADILAIQNADELFEEPELSAACDVGWPDCFNSGMFVFSPSMETYAKLLSHAETSGSFDGGDQGLLNSYFTNWNRVSFIYNMVSSATYTYLPAYKQFGNDVKFVHFLGSVKPWHQRYHRDSGTIDPRAGQEHVADHLNTWWRICTTYVQPEISHEPPQEPVVHMSYTNNVGHDMTMQVHESNIFHIPSIPSPTLELDVSFFPLPPSTSFASETPSSNQESTVESRGYEPDTNVGPVAVEIREESEHHDEPAVESSEAVVETGDTVLETVELFKKLSERMIGLNVAANDMQESKQRWESGIPDYLGKDSFDNIQAYMDAKLNSPN